MNPNAGKWSRAGSAGLFVLDHVQLSASVPTTGALVLEADPMRIALMLSSAAGGNFTVYFNKQGVAGDGLYIAAGARPIFINDDNMPGLAAQRIWAIANNAQNPVNVVYVRIV